MFLDINVLSDFNIYLFFIIVPFLVQIGIFPIWLMFFIITAWALSENLNELFILFFIILFSTSFWDLSAYIIARYFWESKLMKTLLKNKKFNKFFEISKIYFEKRWWITIFLTRFLITWIWPYINYIVWLQSFKFKKFLKYMFFWEILYSLELLLLWYIFKDTLSKYFNIIYSVLLIILIMFILYESKKYISKYAKKNKTFKK